VVNTYISWVDWQRATSGLEWGSLVGNTGRLNSTLALGVTSLPVRPNLTVQINQDDEICIFDGSSTEIVTATTTAVVGASSITTTATTFGHVNGTPYCTDGVLGSLATQIIAASGWMEKECYQSLLLTTYTTEQLTMPTPRACISNRGSLMFRPRHWPVVSVTGLSITTASQLNVSYDTSTISYDGNHRLCSIRTLVALPGNQQQQNQPTNLVQVPFDRNTEADLFVTYSAGYTYSALPGDLKEATILATSDLLAKRNNPIGAPEIGSGGVHLSAVLRGDMTGESILIKRALKILAKYAVETH